MKRYQLKLNQSQTEILSDLAKSIEANLNALRELQKIESGSEARLEAMREKIRRLHSEIEAGRVEAMNELVGAERSLEFFQAASVARQETIEGAAARRLVEATAAAKDVLQSQLGQHATEFRKWVASEIVRFFPEAGKAEAFAGDCPAVRGFYTWLGGYWWNPNNPAGSAEAIMLYLRPILTGEFPFLKD